MNKMTFSILLINSLAIAKEEGSEIILEYSVKEREDGINIFYDTVLNN